MRERRPWAVALAACLALDGAVPLAWRADVLQEQPQLYQPVRSSGGIVASQDGLASAVGAQVLRQGGNAVDAAVATSFALAVTHPQAGNLGGGGFLVLWLPGPSRAGRPGCGAEAAAAEQRLGRGVAVAVNFRESAPRRASSGLFLDARGGVDRELATRSLRSTAVPGTVAGLGLVQRCYGRLSLAQVLAPAIALADQGLVVGPDLAASLALARPLLDRDPTSRSLFLGGTGRPPAAGSRWRQPQLARTLRGIAAAGEAGFYQGPVADQLVRLMRQGSGLIEHRDLSSYRARLVKPLLGQLRGGHAVLTMPPPGGGVTLLQLLHILEPMQLERLGLNGAATIHRMAEAMNLAYRDRNHWLADPDQIRVPTATLISQAHAAEQRARLQLDRHRPAAELVSQPLLLPDNPNTTHLSVVDRQGGLVATTTTLNFAYGNGISVPGAGFLLNNQMDDFTAKPGSPNAYGLVQGEANAIAPGRRPLSSMTPTLVMRPSGEPWLATGSPGGSRIITTVLQVILNRLVHGLNLATAVATPRIHSQLWPDQISLEPGISPDTQQLLGSMGHRLVAVPAMGSANSVEWLGDAKGSLGVADPRKGGAAAVAESPP